MSVAPAARIPTFRYLILAYSSGLFTGYIPWASGTWATALAMGLLWPIARFNRLPSAGGQPWVYVGIIFFLSLIGVWASGYAERVYGETDPHRVTIDEIIGTFITMFLIPFTPLWIILGFFVFRFFDVLKPPPIYKLQSLHGGVGVVIDDIVAGIYSCIVLQALHYFIR